METKKQSRTWYHTRTRIEKWLVYLLIVLIVVVCLIPFYTMLVNATRSGAQIVSGFSMVPSSHFFENFDSLLVYVDVWRGLLNSAFIAVSATILTAYFSTLTAFGFQFYEFKGKTILFTFMILMMMVPQQLGLIGFYQLCLQFKMIDSYYPLIIPMIANTFGVFFIRQYMAGSVHPALVEAARIDGAGEFSIFHRLIIPLAAPATATMAIMAFIVTWNNYIAPRVLITSLEKRTLPVMVGALKGSIVAQSNFGATYAAVAISVVPIMIVFIFASRYIINGIASGSVKG
ncbi:MAG: carbohydrate ABC transporter permease [Vallitaleaceae bacterium]|jgi:multiple sugar transport system permease protein|nr:carbohydrate ABC transporter permease [Vallitaleaceae bacterium]